MTTRIWLTAFALLPITACGGQVGEESGLECAIVNSTPLAPDEVSALGFSANDVRAHLGSERLVDLSWADGGVTTATVSFGEINGTVMFHEREWVGDSNGQEDLLQEAALGDCDDEVEVPLPIAFSTADGAFEEAWQESVRASAADLATLRRDVDQVDGTFELSPYIPQGDWNSVKAWLSIGFGADTNGEITGQAAGEDGEFAFAENFNIAELRSDGEF